ncbi:putative ABC transporter peptide-binding protein YtcQ [Paenibacillus baekrokdamisoli]|uniref:Putative ABC transporter peptide-binding protein YtcQ n=1 Tax=Paenibacillus baekrokdamisoli TaxID=1712516 RepID=A0A3G9IU51_9BACL|nr:extracellular solute-binding protein [Paenibacillus baekrokdamisoli]MBB3072548.1 multiple sugar transport system substrate-binding protein/putative aldouronate transport system substrate-binding protein [Paenibacillus baekrokdamisoli]BBH22400.1 putative ABC transporter peptide-binding protein YtcQ [Paenibacillus baekrokdamisoli]
MFRKSNKLVLLFMVIFAVVSILSGCGGNNNEKTAATSPSSTNGTEDTSTPSSEPVELSVFSWMFEGADAPDSLIYKKLQEKLNIRIKPITASWNDWEEKLNVMIASGEMPDVFVSYGIDRPVQYRQWIKEGMILPISDYAGQYPNIQKSLANFAVLAKTTGDKHYALPIYNEAGSGKDAVSGHNILIRKDWLDKLHLQVPTTLDEFYAVAKAFTENDPDGNNKKDTYGYTSSSGGVWWQYPIFNAFDTSTDRWENKDGQWSPEVISDKMKDAVSFLNKMYNEKILDPEFMLNTDDKKIEKFVTGKVGIIIHNANATFYNDIYNKFKQAKPEADPKSIFTWVGTMKGKTGIQRMDGFNNFWCETSINAGISEEKQKKALELLDYLLSDEGQDLMLNGIEGVHYKKDGDKIVPLMTDEEKSKDKAFSLKALVSWNSNYLPDSMPNKEDIVALSKSTGDYAVPNPLAYLNISEKALDPSVPTQLNDLVNEEMIKLIVNSKDVTADFAKFKETWLAKGGTKVIEETNKEAAAEGR